MRAIATPPPTSCATTNPGTEAGAMPANVSEKIRPMLIAGLAKLVELVNQYAAPMYAPTAAGAACARPVRASEKITSSRPSVATTSAKRCAPLARWFCEMLTAASANMTFAAIAPLMQPTICAGT